MAHGITIPMRGLIRRELLRSLRRLRPFLIMLALLMFCSLMAIANWPWAHGNIHDMGRATQNILMAISFTLLTAVAIVVPAFGATSIVTERDQNTLDLLSVTLLSPLALVLGKLINAMGLYVLLVMACAPVLATLFFLIGLDYPAFFGALAVILATGVSCGALSVMCSTLRGRAVITIIGAYFFTACVMGLPFALGIMFMEVFDLYWLLDHPSLKSLMWIAVPPVTIAYFLQESMGLYEILQAIAFHLTVATIAILVAARQARRSTEPDLPITTDRPRGLRQRLHRILHGTVPKQKPIPDHINPTLAREIRHCATTRTASRRRLFCVMALMSLIIVIILAREMNWRPSSARFEELVTIYVGYQIFALGLLIPAVAANTLTKERERNTLDLLRTTLLKPHEIVLGKTGAVIIGIAPAFAATMLGWVFLWFLIQSSGIPIITPLMLMSIASVTACILVAVGLAILASAAAKRTVTSLILAYAMIAWVFFGMCMTALIGAQLLWSFTDSFIYDSPIFDVYQDIFIWLSPLIAFFAYAVDSHRPLHAIAWAGNVLYSVVLSAALIFLATKAFSHSLQRNNKS